MNDARAFLLGLRSQALLADAVAAAASLGIAERLVSGPRPVAALAEECAVDSSSLYRLLRTLASHGVFAETESGEFRLTEAAELLRPGAEGSLHGLLAGEFPRLVRDAYRELEGAVRGGQVAFERAHGAPFFDYLAAHPAAADRCVSATGDFFTAVPHNADLYLLKRILHDWEDADAARILRTVRAAMGDEARLAVIDAVMKPGNTSDPNKDLDLNMMVLTGGRERTANEFRDLLASTGFELLAIHDLPDPVTLSIVEARPC